MKGRDREREEEKKRKRVLITVIITEVGRKEEQNIKLSLNSVVVKFCCALESARNFYETVMPDFHPLAFSSNWFGVQLKAGPLLPMGSNVWEPLASLNWRKQGWQEDFSLLFQLLLIGNDRLRALLRSYPGSVGKCSNPFTLSSLEGKRRTSHICHSWTQRDFETKVTISGLKNSMDLFQTEMMKTKKIQLYSKSQLKKKKKEGRGWREGQKEEEEERDKEEEGRKENIMEDITK